MLVKRTKVRGVYIKFKGDAETKWYETIYRDEGTGDDRKRVSERVEYRSHESYLRFTQYFVGGNSGMKLRCKI